MADNRNVTFCYYIFIYFTNQSTTSLMVYFKTYCRDEIFFLFCPCTIFFEVSQICFFFFPFIFRDDYLKISNDKDQTLGLFCRDRTGKAVLVTGVSAIIKFRSDFFLEKKGFQLFFTSVPIGREYESR